MSFLSLLNKLDAIGAESSTTKKKTMLARDLQDPQFRKLIQYMLDPFKTYGILDTTCYDAVQSTQEPVSSEEFFATLDKLVSRELSGNAARREMTKLHLRGVPDELLVRILNKDPRAGFGDSLVNKAFPGTLPEFPYMRCSGIKKSKIKLFNWAVGVYAQLKMDGMFCNLTKYETDVVLSTRQGTMLPVEKFGDLVETALRVLKPNTQTHGELVVIRDNAILAREIGNGLINSMVKGEYELASNETIAFHAWDQVPLAYIKPKGKYEVSYRDRIEDLEMQLSTCGADFIELVEMRLLHSLEEVKAYFIEVLKRGEEGLVLKDGSAIWFDGTSPWQIKLKLEAVVDLKLVGFREGKGQHVSTFGSAIMQSLEGQLEVAISGFTLAKRKEIHDNRERLLAEGAIFAIKGNCVTYPSAPGKKHSIFLPRSVEIRTDKTEADTLARVIEQFDEAIETCLEF